MVGQHQGQHLPGYVLVWHTTAAPHRHACDEQTETAHQSGHLMFVFQGCPCEPWQHAAQPVFNWLFYDCVFMCVSLTAYVHNALFQCQHVRTNNIAQHKTMHTPSHTSSSSCFCLSSSLRKKLMCSNFRGTLAAPSHGTFSGKSAFVGLPEETSVVHAA